MASNRITAAGIAAAIKAGHEEGRRTVRVHAGFPGLYAVSTKGIKGGTRCSWVFRVMIDGKSTDRGFGSLEYVTLSEARQMAADLMVQIRARRRDGLGLPESKRTRKTPTFADCASKAFEAASKTWTAATVKLWHGIVRADYMQPLLGRPVDKIDGPAVLAVLVPLYNERPAMGRKVRNVIRKTLALAQAHKLVESNAAGEAIDGGLPETVAVKEHRKALPYSEIGAALAALAKTNAAEHVVACINLIALTGVRSDAARGARAEEFDLDTDRPSWTVPGERSKRKNGHKDRPHRIPLSAAAVAIVRARIETVGDGLLFPTSRGTAIPNSTTIRAWRKVSDTDVHGLRTGIRSWALDNGFPREIAESVLGHRGGADSTEASYTHGSDPLCERKRDMVSRWAAYIGA